MRLHPDARLTPAGRGAARALRTPAGRRTRGATAPLHSRRVPPPYRGILAAALGAVGLLLAPSAGARSALVFPAPEHTGEIEASTYDPEGRRIGTATMRIQRLDSGNVVLEAESGIEGSAHSVVRAELRPISGESGLRLLRERTHSTDEDGRSLGVMRIDHQEGYAVCAPPPDSDEEPTRVALPEDDRVVNVPLNLLFQPLVEGAQEQVRFQILLCRAGARIFDAKAEVAGSSRTESGDDIVEVRYTLDFGTVLSRLAAPFLPRLSFWFQPDAPGTWVGHRMPLFSKGPTVFVVRSGFASGVLGENGASP